MSDPPLLRFSQRDDKQVLIEADIRCPDLAALKLPVEPALRNVSMTLLHPGS